MRRMTWSGVRPLGSCGACLAALLVVGFFWPEARTWLWTPALLVAGAACLVNASRCGRLHCYFTGPLYLLAAVATLLRGFEGVPLRWSWILYAVLGGSVLAYVPEWVRGKYVRSARAPVESRGAPVSATHQ